MGITKPTPIQALAIEPVLQGKDVIAKAETGTGKTLAFGAPMMSKIDPSRSTVLGLVLSPTRELAEQVHDVLKELGEASGIKTTLIVGGEQMGPQVRALQAGAQVVVGTPGRVLDLLNQRFLQFPWTEFAILDEADKMLEIGFIDDVKKILDACNEYRQTLLFSATFPTPLLELARGYTTDPAEIATASGVSTVDNINQYFLRCGEEDRARGARPPHRGFGRGRRVPGVLRAPDRRGSADAEARASAVLRQGAPRRLRPGRSLPGHGCLPDGARSSASWPPTWPPAGST